MNRTPIRHPRRGALTHGQQMFLLYGFDEKWADAFRDKTHYEETWAQHREHILAGYRHGRRPIAWWVIEGPCKYVGNDAERRFLFEHDLLDAEEREELIRCWRQDFENGHRWSDVPSALWAEWETQRPDAVAAASPAEPAGAPEGRVPPSAA
jgi:hypothetical protein